MRLTRPAGVCSLILLLAARGADVRFTGGPSAASIPFDDANRHVAVAARINGRDGMRLVLDTGAGSSVLGDTTAQTLGLEAVGRQQAVGAGGSEDGSIVRGVNVDLPGLTLADQTMATLALTPIAAQGGRPIDGILGHPLFASCVVEIDYRNKRVSFFDPPSYRYAGSGIALPLTFKARLPYVTASLVLPDGRSISGKFVIDTGAATNVLLTPEVVQREGILPALGKTLTVQARGVGGARDVRLARAARLSLPGLSIERPVIAVQPDGVGRISAPGTVGNIGGGVLSRFKVIFDYSRRRMILEPGPDLSQPFEADMSGLGLTSIPPEFRRITVARITDGSPALDAGVQVGDEIESVNGTPAGDIGLHALREMLRVDGQDLRLDLLRGAEHVSVSLRTRRMI